MSLTAVTVRNQRNKNRQQMLKSKSFSSSVSCDQDQHGQQHQQRQQQLKMLKAMKLASQEDHRYYASVDKTVVHFPPAAIKANAVALNYNSGVRKQSNTSRHSLSLASSSHLSIRSDYGEAPFGNEEVLQ